MPKRYGEESEQDWAAAFDAILMLGNVDLFYYPDRSYSYDLYHYVVTDIRWRLGYIRCCLTEKAEVTATLDQMLDMCEDFHTALYDARYSHQKMVKLSESELRKLATVFLDEMSKPITKLVKTYDIHPPNQYFTEMMVRAE